MATIRAVASLLTLLLTGSAALAQQTAGATKAVNYVQTNATAVSADPAGAYAFRASFEDYPTSRAQPFVVTPPGGAGRGLSFDLANDVWNFVDLFASQAALDAAYPNGAYNFTAAGQTTTGALAGDLYPSAPLGTFSSGTWDDGVLTVNRSVAVTATFTYAQNFIAGASVLNAYIYTPTVRVNAGSRSATQTQLSITIPADSLVPGVVYPLHLQAIRIVASSPAPGLQFVTMYNAETVVRITAAGVPVFSSEPASQQVASGSTAVFNSSAANARRFVWSKNGVALAGATGATLAIQGATAADAGDYTVTATNASGSTTSRPARLTVVSGGGTGRLVNLSVLTDVTASDSLFTIGFVLGGSGTSGGKALLMRAAGPSLAPFGVSGALADPRLALFADQSAVGSNDDWSGTSALADAFSQVGAFAWGDRNSKDAAIYNASLAPRAYTVQVSGAGNSAGSVLAELYDATPTNALTTTTPRLVNLSILKRITAGGTLTLGFVVGGTTPRTMLVRAVGPALSLPPFNLAGTMPDPQLQLFNGSRLVVAANDDWGGDSALAAAGSRVGAFAINAAASRDAMLLVTLPPGSYTAQAGPVTGYAGGLALIEVYEVP